MENVLPIDLSLLLIKRKSKNSFNDFIMYYHGEVFDQEQLDSEKISVMYDTLNEGIDDGYDFLSPPSNEMDRMKKYFKKPTLTHLSSEAVDSLLVNR